MLYKIGVLVTKGYVLLLIMGLGGLVGANLFGMFGGLLSEITSDGTHAPDYSIMKWCMHGGWFVGVGVALFGRIMQQRKAAKSSSEEAEQDQTKPRKRSIRRKPKRTGKPDGILSSTFWGGVIGGIGGLMLGLSFLLLFFSLTYSPFSPESWVESVRVEWRRDTVRPQDKGYVMTTDHPVAVYAVCIPAALGLASGAVIGGVAGAMGKVTSG
jgi:hypothetical protein